MRAAFILLLMVAACSEVVPPCSHPYLAGNQHPQAVGCAGE
jgi:hypothetical protein